MLPRLPGFALLTALLLLCLLGGLWVGAAELSVERIFTILGHLMDGNLPAEMVRDRVIFLDIRLPRVLLGALVGAALGTAGAVMQGLFRNPLAEPGLIGISSGAALGVAMVIVSGVMLHGVGQQFLLAGAAFIGGFITVLTVFRLSRLTGSTSVTYMLLAGIAINALALAGTWFVMYLSTDQQLRAITFWTMGSLGGAMWVTVLAAACGIIPALLVMRHYARPLNLMLLGDHEAAHLGVDTETLKRHLVLVSALAVGVAVSVSGIIAFVGLIVPHLVRLLLGADHRVLIPGSALLGASMMLLADMIARSVVAPAELPIGILTSLIGGPFFLFLLIRQRHKQGVA